MLLFLLLPGTWSEGAASRIELLAPAEGSTTSDTRPSDNPLASHTGDLSIPAPVYFCWKGADSTLPAEYSIYLSKDSLIDSTDLCGTGISDTFQALWNLEIGTRYFWMVSAGDNLDNSVNSPLQTFTTAPFWPRMLWIDGTTNVRDIGGRATIDGKMIQQGLLLRSAEFNARNNITVQGLEQLRRLGIVTEIDLKTNSENPESVIPWLPNYFRPLSNEGDGMALYLDGLTQTPEVVCAVFKEMAKPDNYPMIIHCRYGADRTAEIVAMLEATLGCSDEQIALNYMWTSLSTIGKRDTISPYWIEFIDYVKSFDNGGGTFRQGSRNFLQSIGVTAEELAKIEEIFLVNTLQSPARVIKAASAAGAPLLHSPNRPYLHIAAVSSGYSEPTAPRGSVFNLLGKRVFSNRWSTLPETGTKSYSRFAQGRYIIREKE